jgi:hypothetical protein
VRFRESLRGCYSPRRARTGLTMVAPRSGTWLASAAMPARPSKHADSAAVDQPSKDCWAAADCVSEIPSTDVFAVMFVHTSVPGSCDTIEIESAASTSPLFPNALLAIRTHGTHALLQVRALAQDQIEPLST